MTEQTSQQGTVGQDVNKELTNLKSEIQQLSKDIQERISAAGEEAKKTWGKLQDDRKRFFDRVEQVAEETKVDVQQAGSDLKRRLGDLRKELAAQGQSEGSSQASKTSGTSS
jgi:ElaB/YqjD/DUF883 family membrane-anchored ribosome-binding protein